MLGQLLRRPPSPRPGLLSALQMAGRRWLATAPTAVASSASASTYTAVTEDDLKAFERILNDEGKLIKPTPGEPTSLEAYTSDWTRKWSGPDCPAVLQPRTTEQVSALLRHCNDRGIGVVPQVRFQQGK